MSIPVYTRLDCSKNCVIKIPSLFLRCHSFADNIYSLNYTQWCCDKSKTNLNFEELINITYRGTYCNLL